jgi:hypothetical protein
MEAPGQMKVIVVIASRTRGFAVPEADTPPVIRPYAGPLQDQDEKRSLPAGLPKTHYLTSTRISR